MKTLLISSLFVIGAYSGVAQNFTRHTTIASGGADTRYIQWVNFDNDSLLEVVVMWMDAAQSGHITFYRNNSTTLSPVDTIDTGLSGITEFLVTDVDSDNAIDLVVSGMAGNNPSTMAFLNKGNFDFQADTLVSRKASVIAFADLDQDGGHEMLISGADTAGYFHIYQRHGTLWELVADTFAIAALTIQTYDFDNDTDTDFFVSGTDGDGAEVSAIFYNRRGFVFEKRGTGTIAGHSSVSDLDHDGLLDVLVAGDSGTAVLFNKRETLEARDSLPVLGNPIVFTGDMTSDGRCDLSMLGTAITGTRMHIIARSDGSYDTLAADGIVTQAFGDFDADGDLDVAHVTDGVLVDSITVSLNGTAETNEKPGAPFNATGEVIFDKLFLQWQKPLDDHTESASLTYDVTIRAMGKNIVTAGFDSATTRRKVVSHGNAGTANYMLLDTQASGFSYSIQAVDNAYVGSDLCKGGGISCGSVVVADTIEACRNEVIVLEGSSAALWFSFRTGFIGEAQSLNVIAAETDTIFSVTPGATGEICAFITVYTIQLRHSLKKVTDATRYVCRGQSIELTADAGFQASWSSFRKGFLSNEAT
ncbi:MAG TPA: VCBS repeat-containing protein, partial [Chryseosolibacter sp.]|nr:VCBS repeat-containing protein [Chryseosolibacter sp.]